MKKNQLTTTKSTSLALGKTKSLIGITAKILKPKRKDLVIHEDITIIGDLVWEKEIPKDQMTWDEAMTYAKNLKQGGYNDWRLATVDELLEIGREGKIPIREDSNSEKSISYGYWTSTISESREHNMMSVACDFGYLYYEVHSDTRCRLYAPCVRGK